MFVEMQKVFTSVKVGNEEKFTLGGYFRSGHQLVAQSKSSAALCDESHQPSQAILHNAHLSATCPA